MVFQKYALYPHMTARENIAFPLRLMGVKRGEIERVEFSGARYLVAGSLGESKIAIETGERRTAGERLRLYADRAALHFFDPLSGRRID
jgi:ABC-type Fe3+/spermidine/putrescine transport system ATPase subunit